MLFNSFPFFIFYFIVFFVYFLPAVRSRVKLQNLWLLLASYFFYGYADNRNIIVTPHIGGGTIESRIRLFNECCENAIKLL